ncbi:unnamed protein product (macronuclear) [Paramecium tetraurelia]|uniref:Histidine phosphatase family (Branch 2) protein n=1 Tax=Paramecium tetraurelia TaxID=5888 RepID=A0EDS8_PARTE|nr:uncharacterized protein GSPATT00025789001 [Paramecium tetraurelia]CAK93445.1 unnamed protein product [Paramecium tetraurelia]|eukprot:XP_001460842.1 hypothetical protein (macronuclear) [Paramecium tetraurelia strain d4-2]
MIVFILFTIIHSKQVSFLRHGIRSPNDYNDLDKELWRDYPQGYLTQKGFDQVRQMALNNFTIHDGSGICNYDSFHLISSAKPRVIHSVIAFIQGLCPQNYNEILVQYFRDYYQQYSTDQQNFNKIINSNFSDPFSQNFETFKMTNDFMFHGHKSEQCPLIDVLDDALYSSAEYNEINKQVRQHPQFNNTFKLFKKCNPNSNVTEDSITITQLKKLYSNILCNEAQGLYDYNLNQEQVEYLMNIFKFQYFGIDYSQPLQHQATLSYILKWLFQEFYSEVEESFFYGHDDNQYALLSVIIKEWPYVKFAGRLQFKITDDYVNVFLDDRLLITNFCREGVNCQISETIKYLNKYINPNIERDCQLII